MAYWESRDAEDKSSDNTAELSMDYIELMHRPSLKSLFIQTSNPTFNIHHPLRDQWPDHVCCSVFLFCRPTRCCVGTNGKHEIGNGSAADRVDNSQEGDMISAT